MCCQMLKKIWPWSMMLCVFIYVSVCVFSGGCGPPLVSESQYCWRSINSSAVHPLPPRWTPPTHPRRRQEVDMTSAIHHMTSNHMTTNISSNHNSCHDIRAAVNNISRFIFKKSENSKENAHCHFLRRHLDHTSACCDGKKENHWKSGILGRKMNKLQLIY